MMSCMYNFFFHSFYIWAFEFLLGHMLMIFMISLCIFVQLSAVKSKKKILFTLWVFLNISLHPGTHLIHPSAKLNGSQFRRGD